jgi:hypothetical protein
MQFAQSNTLDLKYYLKLPTTWDWGRAGKLPVFYGGAPCAESGCIEAGGWSTRFMWRGGSAGEVYWYAPSGSGCGVDLVQSQETSCIRD